MGNDRNEWECPLCGRPAPEGTADQWTLTLRRDDGFAEGVAYHIHLGCDGDRTLAELTTPDGQPTLRDVTGTARQARTVVTGQADPFDRTVPLPLAREGLHVSFRVHDPSRPAIDGKPLHGVLTRLPNQPGDDMTRNTRRWGVDVSPWTRRKGDAIPLLTTNMDDEVELDGLVDEVRLTEPDPDAPRTVHMPPIRTFGHMVADKWLLLKTLEEAAELVEAGKRWVKATDPGVKAAARDDMVAEWADVAQTLANTAAAFNITDGRIRDAMAACEERNRRKGRL